MNKLVLIGALITLTSACTWVEVTDEGESVVLGSQANVRGCQQLSTTNVSVKDHVGPINRSADKVATELQNLARNEAARLGGDTIVPVAEPSDGRQSFMVYRCAQ
jgi:hypothetical protein